MAKLSKDDIRDYGLVAYLRIKGFKLFLNDNKKSYRMDTLSPEEFKDVTEPYIKHIKPVIDGIVRIKRELMAPKP